jgi:ribosomal-protein-alanine N-acetyltransferase
VAVIAQTARLILRTWRDDDAQPLAEMGSDAEFVRYLQGRPWTIEDAVGMISTCRAVEDSIGVTLWALEDRHDGALVGYCGLGVTNATGLRTDLIEIGWGIERSRWAQGLATEAAMQVLALARRRFGSRRLIAKCHADNLASERVMLRIGLRRAGAVRYLAHSTLIYRAT